MKLRMGERKALFIMLARVMSSEGPYRNYSINKFLEIPIIQNENTRFEILCRQLAQHCENVRVADEGF